MLEAWRTNNRINLFLIERIGDEGMKCTLSKHGGRTVVRQFAHLHNVRLWHLERRACSLAKGLYQYDTHEEPDKVHLIQCLNDSAERIATFIRDIVTGGGKYRTFKKGIINHLAYFIAHESHHRGNILLTLKMCGNPVDAGSRYAIWDWNNR